MTDAQRRWMTTVAIGGVLGSVLAVQACDKATVDVGGFPPGTALLEPTLRLPDFELVDQRDEPFTRASLDGKVWVTDFFFTRCPSMCKQLTAAMREIHAVVDDEVQFLSVTVDPDYDRPEILADYAKRQHAEADNWWFVTGDKPAVIELIEKGFKQAVGKQMEGEDIYHSPRLLIVDRNGAIRDFPDVIQDADGKRKAIEAIGQVLAEQPTDEVAKTLLADRAQAGDEAAQASEPGDEPGEDS